MRISFNTADRELALIAGLRPILKKAQWEGRDFTASTINDVPIGSAPYVVAAFEQGRFVTLQRNPDYWGNDLPIRRGTNNLDEIRIEYYGDNSVMFEAFKAGAVTVWRESNAEDWETRFDFDAVRRGDVILSEIAHERPTGMTGFVMNTARPHLADWRVREALLLAFNFPYINGTVTGGRQPRITSYFSNSELGLEAGACDGPGGGVAGALCRCPAPRRAGGIFPAPRRRVRAQPQQICGRRPHFWRRQAGGCRMGGWWMAVARPSRWISCCDRGIGAIWR